MTQSKKDSEDSLRTIFEQLVQSRQIFIYFIITLNTGIVGFIGNHLLNETESLIPGIVQLFLFLSLILHGVSIFLGLYYQDRAQKIMLMNFELLKEKSKTKELPSQNPKLLSIKAELEQLYKQIVGTFAGGTVLSIISFMIIIFNR